jgi:predicted permease
MQNFLLSFNVVFPIAVLMALGFFIKKIKLVNETTVKQMNNIIFKVFLPMMLFKNVYESDIGEMFEPRLVIYSFAAVIISIITPFILVPIFEKQNSKRGVMIQAMFRSNFVIFGVPITEALCGSTGVGVAAILIATVVPLFNFSAVIALEVFNGNKPDFKKICKGIVTNPLIISSILGLLVNFIGLEFPTVIEKSISNVGSIATPLALIVLGASINFGTVSKNATRLLIGLSVKLVILPAIALFIAAFVFGFRGAELSIMMSLFATPPAVSSFTMAQQMGGDSDLACQLVMFGTVVSVITMFLWVFTFVSLGFI